MSNEFHILNIEKLVAQKYKFSIPAFQRSYEWKEEIQTFCRDLRNYSEIDSFDYSLGTIICCGTADNRLEIIDGQQRLRTLAFLLEVLKDVKVPEVCDQKLIINEDDETNDNSELAKNVLSQIEKELGKDSNKQKKIKRFLLKNVWIRLVELPLIKNDNNRKAIERSEMYEIINNRGIPMDYLSILKAQLINRLDSNDKKSYAERWEKVHESLLNVNENATTQQESLKDILKNQSNEESTKKSCIDFTDLLIYTREIYRNLKTDSPSEIKFENLDFRNDPKGFQKHFNDRVIEGSTDANIKSFFNLLEFCARFVIDFCPYREKDVSKRHYELKEAETEFRLNASFNRLMISFIAANNSRWLLISLYFIASQLKEKRSILNTDPKFDIDDIDEKMIDDWYRHLKRFSFRICVSENDPVTEVLTNTEIESQNIEKLVSEWHYEKKRPTFWIFYFIDWLIWCDARNGFKYFDVKPDIELKESFEKYCKNNIIGVRNSIEHWSPQGRQPAGSREYLHRFGNLALVTASQNTNLWKSEVKIKAQTEELKNKKNLSLKLEWMRMLTEQNIDKYNDDYFDNSDKETKRWSNFITKAIKAYIFNDEELELNGNNYTDENQD